MRFKLILSTVALCVSAGSVVAAEAVSIDGLLDQMTDLKRLAELPDPAYVTRQFSSYDRAAKSPKDNWFANGDSGHFLRVEKVNGREEFVMADADGPGAIVRIWSANPAGMVRIYLDGSEKPAIEAPLQDLLGGKVANLPQPIACETARGWNLYFPIPYAKHCKVTSDKGGFYYHVNYRTYAAGTAVKTFEPADLPRLSAKIDTVAGQLANPLRLTRTEQPDAKTVALPAGVEPGQEQVIAIAGPRAINSIVLQMGPMANQAAALRGLVVVMEFDGEKTVEAPIGDFFGTAPGLNRFFSLPLMVTPQAMTCRSRWVMPFQREARITFRNLGKEKVNLAGAIANVPYEWTDRSLLFHAGWRIERDIPSRPLIDWPHLHCTGDGRFVGGALHIINYSKNWWGEGDEKMYIDGEKFPSTFGTGSEDYYGYAWSSSELYTHAYHNQPRCDGPGTYGNNLESRFHILDDMPFTKSFRFDMEQVHHKDNVKVTRAAVSYWYARPGGTDFFKPITSKDVEYIEVPPYTVAKPGTIEGENLVKNVVENTGGEVGAQDLGEPFSNDRQLRWHAGKAGARLTLTFESKQAGPQHVFARFKKAHDFAIVQVFINGQKAGEPIDCYSKDPTIGDEIDLGSFELNNGRNELTLQATGTNPAAADKMVVGLDYIRLK